MTIPVEKRQLTRFACQRCGCCCQGEGIVRLEEDEIPAMAEALGLDPEVFLKVYTVVNEWHERILVDKMYEGKRWCVFLEFDGTGRFRCRVDAAKPKQCVGFPLKWRSLDAFEWCQGLNG